MSELSAGLVNVGNLTVNSTNAGAVSARNFSWSNDLAVGGNLAVTGEVKSRMSTKHRLGVSIYPLLGLVNTREELLALPGKLRNLGVTEFELVHTAPMKHFQAICANPWLPTIEELTPFKQACDAAGITMTGVLVDYIALEGGQQGQALAGSRTEANRDDFVTFVEAMAPVYKFLGAKMMRFNIDCDQADRDFDTDPAVRAIVFANILDTYTRSNVVAQGLYLLAENHIRFENSDMVIELYNYLTTNGVPTFAFVIDTNNWNNFVDKSEEVYKVAPYAYEISLKVADWDDGYTYPNYNKVLTSDALYVPDISADRPFAFHAYSTGEPLDLYKLMDIIDTSSVVAHRNMTIYPEIELFVVTGKVTDINTALTFYLRAFNNITAKYPKFNSVESSMLSHYMLNETSKDVELLNLNLKTITEQSQRNEEIVTQERMLNWQSRTYNNVVRGKKYHYIVVGSGSAGAAAAQALASFTRGKGKFVLMVERGPSRPLTYIGGFNYYSGDTQATTDRLNQAFGRYYIKEIAKLTSKDVERLLDCTTGVELDTSGVANVITNIDNCNDPVVMGGGSTYNGSNTHFVSSWYNERNAVRGGAIIDNNSLKQCADYLMDVVGSNKEDDYYVASSNTQISKIFSRLSNNKFGPWIGDSTGEVNDEFLPSKVIKNLGLSCTESGGIRCGQQSLRVHSTGYPRRNASASLVEQFDNNFYNLDVLTNTKVHKINFERYDASGNSRMNALLHGTSGEYVRDSSGYLIAEGVNVTYNDHVDETTDEPMNILLKETGKIYVAGNVFNSPILLERSGIGKQSVIEACGIEHLFENEHIGEHLHNNIYMRSLLSGLRIGTPPGFSRSVYDLAYQSRNDLRNTLVDNQVFSLHQGQIDFSDRSAIRTEGDYIIPKTDTGYLQWGNFQCEFAGLINNGTVHIDASSTDITVPKVNFDWFDNSSNGRRNLEGVKRGITNLYNYATSAQSAYYVCGSGKDSSGNTVERSPECIAASAFGVHPAVADASGNLNAGWFKSSAGGVYNQGYKTFNLETMTDYDWRSVIYSSVVDSIHWNGTVAHGHATNENFIVKGTQNVLCCCTAVMNEPYPQNNWGFISQWARYIVMHDLGLTTIPEPTRYLKDNIAAAIDTSGEPVPYALDASGSLITFTNYNNTSKELSYFITVGGKTLPVITGKFSGNKLNTTSSGTLQNFRTTPNNEITVDGSGYNAYDCFIASSKLQLEVLGETTLSPIQYIYEWTYIGVTRANLYGILSGFSGIYPEFFFDASGERTHTESSGTFIYSIENANAVVSRLWTDEDLAWIVSLFSFVTSEFMSTYEGGWIRKVELCLYRWTLTGLTWAQNNVFLNDGKGGTINPFDNKASTIYDGVTEQSKKFMTDANPLWTEEFLIDNDYVYLNPYYAEPQPLDTTMRVSYLNLALGAYDNNDRFVDNITGVPVQPGERKFIGPV